ncbi:hypothetical protein Aperf_G00000103368 [Anoplocephala perfoliata]
MLHINAAIKNLDDRRVRSALIHYREDSLLNLLILPSSESNSDLEKIREETTWERCSRLIPTARRVAASHLQKAKELYHTRFKEYERVRLNEAHSVRDMEKAESKLKKAQDEYKYSVEKYNNLRLQFVDKMRISCEHFEQMETAHLTRMCEFFGGFVETIVQLHRAHLSLFTEFNQRRVDEVTPKSLLLNMVEERGTGEKEPPPAEFEDVEVAAAFNNSDEPSGGGGGSLASQSSTPCPSHLASDSSSLRAASALPALGSQECPMTNHQGALDPSWQSSLNEISGTHSSGLSRRAGVLFQRRNRQNSSGLEADNASVNSGVSTPGSFAQKLANVRNLARIPRRTSNSPNEITSKVSQTSAFNVPKVDEEGYNIRPEDPWTSGYSRSPPSDSSSGSSSPSEKTFKGIKVSIRPLGDLSPGVVEVTSSEGTNLTSPRGSVTARDFRRPHTSVDKPFASIPATSAPLPMEARSNSVATAPLVPVLPPPPGQDTISGRRSGRNPLRRGDGSFCSFESSKASSITTPGDVEPFNPFGLLKSDEGTLTANTTSSWDAVFKSDGSVPTSKIQDNWKAVFNRQNNSNETYGLPINRHGDTSDKQNKGVVTSAKPKTSEKQDSDELSIHSICHAPLAALDDDDETSSFPPLPPPPTLPANLPPPTLPRFSTEPRALPPPVPPLPIAIALTETWRAQFPNGGGSSFTTTERPAQSLFGQVTLAVAREDLRLLTHSKKTGLKPLVLIFSRAQRMRNVQTTFGSVSVQMEGGEKAQYRVTIPGDLLYQYLVETQSEATDEEYTRLSLLDYTVESSGVPPPITMCTFWRCENSTTDFRLDYFVQWPKWSSASPSNVEAGSSEISCQDLRVNLLVDGGVVRMQSRPLGTWDTKQTRASWSIPLSPMEFQSQIHPGVDVSGNIRAKFFLSQGPGTPQPVALQFCRDGGCLPSGALLSLGSESLSGGGGGVGYRLTMCKYRLLGDRYFCDPPVPLGGIVKCLPLLSPPSSRAQPSS